MQMSTQQFLPLICQGFFPSSRRSTNCCLLSIYVSFDSFSKFLFHSRFKPTELREKLVKSENKVSFTDLNFFSTCQNFKRQGNLLKLLLCLIQQLLVHQNVYSTLMNSRPTELYSFSGKILQKPKKKRFFQKLMEGQSEEKISPQRR